MIRLLNDRRGYSIPTVDGHRLTEVVSDIPNPLFTEMGAALLLFDVLVHRVRGNPTRPQFNNNDG